MLPNLKFKPGAVEPGNTIKTISLKLHRELVVEGL